MRVIINGDSIDLEDGTPLPALLSSKGWLGTRVAVERNGVIVRRHERDAVVLQDHDVLEVVTLVGGG
jgi:sulfur carrier protein